MKKITLFMFVLSTLVLNACVAADSSTDIARDELVNVLALGKMTDLNTLPSPSEKDLFVRLYELPLFENDCFVETHGVCQNAYFFSVSTYDEYPQTKVFKLTASGELAKIQWLNEDISDQVVLSVSMKKYTAQALANNPALVDSVSRFTVTLNPLAMSVVTD